MSDILNPFDYEDPVKSNKDESDVRNSFFYVQMIMYGRQLKKIEPDFPFSVKEILKALLGNARSLYFTEYYIKDIILHYRKSRLPFEQDIEKLNTNEFPLNKEIKRFFWNKAVNRFKNIDRYSCAQPPNHEKEKELQKLNVYFKLLKAHAYDYYPQLGELPARGLRELERTLYTLNYICVLDLQEARDRMLGLRTERICKIDNLNEQIRTTRKKKAKENKKRESFIETWQSMSKEEKKEWDQRINERIELEGRCQLFHNDLVLSAGTYYMKIFPEYELDKDNFLSQASYNCSLITDVAFYESENITVHYSQSEDAYSQPFKKHEPHSVYERYLKSKQNFPKEFNMNIFQSVLTEDDKNCLEFEIKFYAMKKKVLQTLHEHFPLIPSLLPQGIRDIDLLADHVTYMLIMDLHTSKNRVKGECKDYFEKLDKDVEEKLRKEEYL